MTSYAPSWLYSLDGDGTWCEIISGARLFAAMPRGGVFHVDANDCQWTNGVLPFALDPCSVDDNGVQTWEPITFADPTWVGNPAPWWDGVAGSPSSKGYGIWVEEWTGLDGAHHKRNVSPRAGRRGGANFGTLYSGNRVWAMNLILVGGSAAALEDLFRWLETALLDCCDPCGGQEMLIRTTCPPDGDPSFGVYRAKNVAMIQGPQWESPPVDTLGCYLRRVSVTLSASDPCLYSCITPCTEGATFPVVGGCVPFSLWWGCNRTCTDMDAYRICCPVPATGRGQIAPIVTLQNNSEFPSASVRIYGMLDPLDQGCDPCSLSVCQDIITRSIPAGGTLVVDSSTGRTTYTHPADTGGVPVDGTPFLDPPPGTVPSYLALTCDQGWVAIEPFSFCGNTDDLSISVDLVQRVGCC